MKVQWRFMGNSPVDGNLRHIGDVDEYTDYQGTGLVASGHCFALPADALVQDAPRAEPSLIGGINISEEALAVIEAEREASATVINTPVEVAARGKGSK